MAGEMVENSLSKEKEQSLKRWVEEQLVQRVSKDEKLLAWAPLTGDAGFRKYFRIKLRSCDLIAVYSPPETENNEAFFQIDQFFYVHGVHVPKIMAHDMECGFFLLEDLGETLYLDHLDQDSAQTLYGEALLALLNIQQCPKDESIFAPYDRNRLLEEMGLFPDWFVTRLLGYSLSDQERALIDDLFDVLVQSALAQPQVIVHRDFHSRNIVYGPGGKPGVIDFQDAVIGPFTYDLVSILRDCYIAWPQSDVENWLRAYTVMAQDVGIIADTSLETVSRWFDWMGLQRHIKVLGIFARLSLRDSKHAYLDDLPLVVHYVRTVASQYAETEAFAGWFDDKLLPLIQKQPWMDGP